MNTELRLPRQAKRRDRTLGPLPRCGSSTPDPPLLKQPYQRTNGDQTSSLDYITLHLYQQLPTPESDQSRDDAISRPAPQLSHLTHLCPPQPLCLLKTQHQQ